METEKQDIFDKLSMSPSKEALSPKKPAIIDRISQSASQEIQQNNMPQDLNKKHPQSNIKVTKSIDSVNIKPNPVLTNSKTKLTAKKEVVVDN